MCGFLQTSGRVADIRKFGYLMWIFANCKAAVQILHDCLVFMQRAAARCACRFARLLQMGWCVSHANFIGSCPFRSILAAAVQKAQLHSNHASVLWLSWAKYASVSFNISRTNTLCVAAVLRPHKIAKNHKENGTC